MRTYPEELKSQVIARMFPPHNCSVSDLAKETNIPKETLYSWRNKYRFDGLETDSKSAKNFTGSEKFQFLLETATLNEQETGEFCRHRGIFPEQLSAWRQACEAANEYRPRREVKAELREVIKKNKTLEMELRRKEKALAEVAALLVLKKKAQDIWGEEEGVKLV